MLYEICYFAPAYLEKDLWLQPFSRCNTVVFNASKSLKYCHQNVSHTFGWNSHANLFSNALLPTNKYEIVREGLQACTLAIC